jgi:hypothetical protein
MEYKLDPSFEPVRQGGAVEKNWRAPSKENTQNFLFCGLRSMWAGDSSGCGHRKRSDVGSDYAAMWARF